MWRRAIVTLFLAASLSDVLSAQDSIRAALPDTAYIPTDLEDALRHLQRLLPPQALQYIRDSAPENMAFAHFGLGLTLRNQWGLWAGSRLAAYFNSIGIYHPDDMSGIILTSLWRRLHDQPIALLDQVRFYQTYWRIHRPPDTTVFPGCPSGVDLRGGVPMPRDSASRFVHLGTCTADSVWWAFEIDRGWYRPDSALVARFRRLW